MSFQPISHFDSIPPKPHIEPFVTVNAYSTGYLGGGLFDLLGNPRFLVIEYDDQERTLRMRGSEVGTYLKNQAFALPRLVVEKMANRKYTKPYAQRYAVEKRDDGWWYTTHKINRRGIRE